MNKILVDTSVWLDLAKDFQQEPVLDAIEELISSGKVELILPKTVVEEFNRNKARIAKESKQSLSTVFRRVKDAVNKFGDTDKKQSVLDQLSDIDYKMPLLGEGTANLIVRIDALFNRSKVIKISNSVKLRAAQRAIDKIAPFHLHKNSINDAILIEVYKDILLTNGKDVRSYFVTHNTKDFSSANDNENKPHGDIAIHFLENLNSKYAIRLAEVLHEVEPDLISEKMMDYKFIEEPRALTEIIEAEKEFFEKIWYNRHQNWLHKIKIGEYKIVDKLPKGRYPQNLTTKKTFNGARKAARKMEKKYGKKNLGPWDDFEWGMMNGKLSALRWVTGSDWDFLDT